MRKTVLYLAALAASASAAATPMNSYAASGQVYIGNGCSVIEGQGLKSLCQTLEELGITIGSGNIVCPGVTQPDCSNPDDSNGGDNDLTPDDSNNENNSAGTTPETPEVPETPEAPDAPEAPETPENPDDGNSGSDTGSGEEQPGEEVVSEAEQVVKLVNEERAKRGLSALTIDTKVTAAANVRAREIKQSFAHTRPDGTSFSTALKEQGVTYRGSGENIAWGQKSPEEVMNAWMGSDGHRANILNENYKNIGVGYYQDANGVKYWVQLFTY